MPVSNGRGYSEATIDKEDGLQKILAWHIAVVEKIFEKHSWPPKCYYYIDAYAGPGANPEVGAKGSPAVFLEAAKNATIPWKAWFIDKEQNNTMVLRARIGESENFEIFTGDNRLIVPRVADKLPKNAFGLIYADSTNVPDFDLLGEISRIPELRYFDILIRYSATSAKRVKHLTGLVMRDYLNKIDKKSWIIRDVLPGDNHQWTFLLGQNWADMGSWTSQRFYKVDSKKGKDIFNLCNEIKSRQRKLDGTM